MSVRVVKRTAFAWLFLRIDRFAIVTPVRADSSVRVIFLDDSISSRWQTIRCGRLLEAPSVLLVESDKAVCRFE